MKKLLVMVCALSMLLCMVACSNTEEPASSAPASESNTPAAESSAGAVQNAVEKTWKEKLDAGEEVLVGVIAPAFDNESTIHITDTLTETLEAIGCTVSAVSAELDNANCIAAIENFITQDAAAVCIFPMDSAGIADVCAKAQENGTMIFFFGEKPAYEISGGVISDNTLTGTAVAEMSFDWVKEKYPDAGPKSIGVFVGGCTSNEMNSDYQNALVAAVEASELCYVAYLNTDNESLTVDGGYNMAEQALVADSNIKVFLCMKPDVAIGINNYLESRADLDLADFGIFSSDANQTVAQLVDMAAENGSAVRGLIPFGTDQVGYDLGAVLVDIFEGEKEAPYWAALSLDTYNSFGWTIE